MIGRSMFNSGAGGVGCCRLFFGLVIVSQETTRTTWIGIGLSIACLFAAEAALAAPRSGPGDAVESAVVRFMTIVQSEHANGAPLPADRVGEIREIVREMFDFDEISRRALSKHWQALQCEEQVEFVALFRDLAHLRRGGPGNEPHCELPDTVRSRDPCRVLQLAARAAAEEGRGDRDAKR
jgi:MlaC protein